MKHLRKFEDYDLGPRFSDEEQLNNPQPDMPEEDFYPEPEPEDETECEPCGTEDGGKSMNFYSEPSEDDNPDEERTWGDESQLRLENVKSFNAFLNEKKKQKEVSYEKSGLKHPEKADLDKNKKISGYEKTRGKAIQNAVQNEKEEKGSKEKGGKGLTAAQKKLPEGLRKAIEAKNKKK